MAHYRRSDGLCAARAGHGYMAGTIKAIFAPPAGKAFGAVIGAHSLLTESDDHHAKRRAKARPLESPHRRVRRSGEVISLM
jgi:hypothetical protein